MEAAGSLEELLSRMEPLIAYCNNRNKKENWRTKKVNLINSSKA